MLGAGCPIESGIKAPAPIKRDSNQEQPPSANVPGSGKNCGRECQRQGERATAQADKGQPHHPAISTKLVFADHVSRAVELRLEEMQRGEEGEESRG
jgi:hypothetical protein